MEEYSREPCPWRIIDDCGGAFTMGLIGGALFNGIQGFRHAPSGLNRRTMGGLVRLKERAPVLGGQFAAWGLCFATFDCSIAYMRQVKQQYELQHIQCSRKYQKITIKLQYTLHYRKKIRGIRL